MVTFLATLFFVGMLIFIVGLGWLIFSLIKKSKNFKVPAILMAVGAVCAIATFFIPFNDEETPTSTAETSSVSENNTSTASKSSSSIKYAGLNEELNNGTYSIKITQVDQNFNEHGQTLLNSDDIPSLKLSQDNGVQITVDYSNINSSENFLPSIFDFAVYDDDGKTGEIINQQDGQTKVSKGHTGTTHFWVNLQKPYANTKYVEIEYSNAHFKIPLNH